MGPANLSSLERLLHAKPSPKYRHYIVESLSIERSFTKQGLGIQTELT